MGFASTIIRRLREALAGWKQFTGDIPAKRGQAFDIRLVNGDEVHGLVAGKASKAVSKNGDAYYFCGCTHHGAILRDLGFFLIPIRLTHYRLRKLAPITAEDATRATRENEWRDWANAPNPDKVAGFEEPKRAAPEKVQS